MADTLPLFLRSLRDVRTAAPRPAAASARRQVRVLFHPVAVLNRSVDAVRGRILNGYESSPVCVPRVWVSYAELSGERKARAAGIEWRLVAEAFPESAKYHRPGRRLWFYDFEDDVRERVLEELRPGVAAMWSDPLERFGVRR